MSDRSPHGFSTRSSAFSSSIFLPCALLATVTIVFSIPSGTDYLYYYLPAAQYLATFRSFPPALLPSLVDAPLAYPPAEFILLALTTFLGPAQALAIKGLLVARAWLFFFLLHALEKQGARREILLLAALLPSLLTLLFLYNTDITVLLALLALALYLQDDRYRTLALALWTYALLSKYTAWPLYALCLAYTVHVAPRKLLWLALPSLALAPFLLKNALLYGNPIFPLAGGLFGMSPENQRLLRAWSGYSLDSAWLLRCVRGVTGCLLGAAAVLPLRRQRLLSTLCVAYTVLWALLMNPGNAGDPVRFLLPIALVVLLALARSDVSTKTVALLVGLQIPLYAWSLPEAQLRLYALVQVGCAVGLVGSTHPRVERLLERHRWGLPAPKTRRAGILLAGLALICAVRLTAKRSFDFNDLGYSVVQGPIKALSARLQGGARVYSDFRPLPLDLRLHSQLVYEGSVLNGNSSLELREERSLEAIDLFFLPVNEDLHESTLRAALEAREQVLEPDPPAPDPALRGYAFFRLRPMR